MAIENEQIIIINGDASGAQAAFTLVEQSSKSTAETIEKDASESAKAVDESFLLSSQNISKAFVASAASFAVFSGAIGFSVAQFAEAEKVQSQLNAVLASTGGAAGISAAEINKLATELSRLTTFDDEAIIGAQTLLLQFDKIGKETFPAATTAILDVATRLNIDLKGAALAVGKALNNPAESLNALRGAGIKFTEEQQLLVQSLVEAGDVAGAQSFILNQLQTAYGGAAQAAGSTFAGSLTQLQNEFANLGEQIGAIFAPILQKAVVLLRNFISVFQENQALVTTTGIVLGLGTAFTGVAFGVLSAIKTIQFFAPAMATLQANLAALRVSLGLTTISIRTLLGATGLGALLVLIGFIATDYQGAVNKMTGASFALFGAVQSTFNAIIQLFQSLGTSIKLFVTGNFTEAINALKTSLDGFRKIGTDTALAYSDGIQIGRTAQAQRDAAEKERVRKEFVDLNNISVEAEAKQRATKLKSIEDQMADEENRTANLKAMQEEYHGTTIESESVFGDNLVSIDQQIGAGQIDVWTQTSDGLISESERRYSELARIESQPLPSRGGTVSAPAPSGGAGGGSFTPFGSLLADSAEGRAARAKLRGNPSLYDNFLPGIRGDQVLQYVVSEISKRGIKFQRGLSGVGAENLVARFSGREIVIPENFAEGIRRGRFALVAAGSEGRPQTPGRSRVEVDIGFRTKEASAILTTQSNKESRLGTKRLA